MFQSEWNINGHFIEFALLWDKKIGAEVLLWLRLILLTVLISGILLWLLSDLGLVLGLIIELVICLGPGLLLGVLFYGYSYCKSYELWLVLESLLDLFWL